MLSAHCYTLEQLQPGLSARFSRTVTAADIANYAGVSGDMNPLHLDDEFGASTQFGSRIAHGMLSAGYISYDSWYPITRSWGYLCQPNSAISGPGTY